MFRFTYTPMGVGRREANYLRYTCFSKLSFLDWSVYVVVILERIVIAIHLCIRRLVNNSLGKSLTNRRIKKRALHLEIITRLFAPTIRWFFSPFNNKSIRYKMLRVAWNTFFAVHLSICRKVNHFYFKHTISHFVAHTYTERERELEARQFHISQLDFF